MIGGTAGTTAVLVERDGAGAGDSSLLLRADTTVTSPPPTTAPTAKQAVCMTTALGILGMFTILGLREKQDRKRVYCKDPEAKGSIQMIEVN